MKRSTVLAALAAALAVVSAPAQTAPWPLSNPEHREYFCGTDGGGQTDKKIPVGYIVDFNRALNQRINGPRQLQTIEAVAELRTVARCGQLAKVGAQVVAAGKNKE